MLAGIYSKRLNAVEVGVNIIVKSHQQETFWRVVWTQCDPCANTESGSNDAGHKCDSWLEMQRQLRLHQ